MILLQIRAGRLRLTLETIDRRKPAKPSDGNKKTAQTAATVQAVKVEVRNTIYSTTALETQQERR